MISEDKEPLVIDGRLQFSFECGGHKFYEFIDTTEMPVARAFAAAGFIEQFNQRTSRDMLEVLYAQIIEACNMGRLVDAINIAQEGQNRLNDIFEPETAYMLATAYYLAEGENIDVYNPELGNKKIAIWKENDHLGFFLREPVKKLLGFSDRLAEEMEEMIICAALQNQRMLEYLGQMRSFDGLTNAQKQKLLLLKETYSRYRQYAS